MGVITVSPTNKLVCLLEPDEAVRTAITALLKQRGWNVNNVKLVREKYSWDVAGRKVINAYDTLLGKNE